MVNYGSGVLEVGHGGILDVAGLHKVKGVPVPANVDFAYTPAGPNAVNVRIQLVDGHGQPCRYPWLLHVLLSDSPTGAGLTATEPVAVAGERGSVIARFANGGAMLVQTNADGVLDLRVMDAGRHPFVVTVQAPGVLPGVSKPIAPWYGAPESA